MNAHQDNVGLGGDGDEISAIEEVENEFGVRLDYSDAALWSTVGDVYAALLAQLPPEEAKRPDVWDRFSRAICQETGISPYGIGLESGLIAEDGLWVSVVSGWRVLFILAILATIIAINILR
jgi:hypothetical protein